MSDARSSAAVHLISTHRHKSQAQQQISLSKSVPKKASSFTLMALTLAACGGGGTGRPEDPVGGPSNFGDKTGNLLKGPVEGAFVFADYNRDGVWNEGLEPSARTDSNGAYRLEGVDTAQSYELVALLDGAVDNSSGTIFGSGSMKASANAQVITPFTTIMVEQELSAQQVAAALGLGDLQDFDPLTFNPYAEGVEAETALVVEKTAHKVMAVVQVLSVVFEQSGEDADTAFAMAIDVVADEVRLKSDNQETLILGGSESSVASLIDTAIVRAQGENDEPVVNTELKGSIVAAANNSIAQIEKVTELSVDGEPNVEFSIVSNLADQIEAAIKDPEVEIALADEDKANAIVEQKKNNSAPEITLQSLQDVISEATTNLVVAEVVATDNDLDDEITIRIEGPDADFFKVAEKNDNNFEISFKEQPNYEEKTSFNITIIATDGIAETAKPLAISITDKEPLASLALNFSKINGLEAKIDADLAAVEQAISGFYSGGATSLLDELYSLIDTFKPSIEDFSVDSTGIVVEKKSTGERLALTFEEFSPSSLEELFDVIVKFNETEDFSELELSGGFSSLSISNGAQLSVQLAHEEWGFEWRNLKAAEGAVDTFVIEGTFGNQISEYIEIFEVAQTSLEGGSSEIDVFINAFLSLSDQIEATGLSAKAGDNLVFRIGDGGLLGKETVEICIAGSDEKDHVLSFTIGGFAELTSGLLQATNDLGGLLLEGFNFSVNEGEEGYFVGADQLVDNLSFSFSYEHGADVVIDARLEELVSLNETIFSNEDDGISVIFAGYLEQGIHVTEISDPQENFVLKLIGVEKSDFLEKYEDQGNDFADTLELYFAAANPEILSSAAA